VVTYNPGIKEATTNRRAPFHHDALLGSFADFIANPLLTSLCETNGLWKVQTSRATLDSPPSPAATNHMHAEMCVYT
jgi:hypothetical protein